MRASGRGWARPVLSGALFVGLLLLALAGRRASWAGQGKLVAAAELAVPGGPPWSLALEVPTAGERYLLESTVAMEVPGRAAAEAAPTYRLTTPNGRRADLELEPLPQARTTWRGGLAEVTTHAWLQPSLAGAYQVELTVLRPKPPEAVPRRWRLRLATNVPPEPRADPLRPLGFLLAAGGLLGLVFLRPAPQSANSPNSDSRKR